MRRKGFKVLKPVHPNSGIAAAYRRKMDDLIREMQASYMRWLRAAYRANPPEMAMDANPPRVTAVEVREGWTVYVDGVLLADKKGKPKTFETRWSAEGAGLRSTPRSAGALVTESIGIEERFNLHELASVPVVPTPAQYMTATLEGLGAQWAANFDAAAPKLASWFTQAAGTRSQTRLKQILADGGMSVPFQMTPAMRDVVDATLAENVSLIRSIGSQYHTEVEGLVMRSITAGRDLGSLTQGLEHRFGITRRRAEHIALSQNNLATSSFVKVRQVELGVKAVWLHSAGGKTPRKTHVANTGKPYDPAVGWFDPDPKVNKHIWPGQLINCRCVSRTMIKGFS